MFDWDAEAAARFQQFRARGIRIGAQDLKIACIALEHDAMLLTRNSVDFAKVPGEAAVCPGQAEAGPWASCDLRTGWIEGSLRIRPANAGIHDSQT